MKLYRTNAKSTWAGTQADARDLCKLEGTSPHSFETVDVPTDKPGLIAWLNDARLEATKDATVAAARSSPEPLEAPKLPTVTFVTLEDVCAFVRSATGADLAHIITLGTSRIDELAYAYQDQEPRS